MFKILGLGVLALLPYFLVYKTFSLIYKAYLFIKKGLAVILKPLNFKRFSVKSNLYSKVSLILR